MSKLIEGQRGSVEVDNALVDGSPEFRQRAPDLYSGYASIFRGYVYFWPKDYSASNDIIPPDLNRVIKGQKPPPEGKIATISLYWKLLGIDAPSGEKTLDLFSMPRTEPYRDRTSKLLDPNQELIVYYSALESKDALIYVLRPTSIKKLYNDEIGQLETRVSEEDVQVLESELRDIKDILSKVRTEPRRIGD